LLCVWRVGSLFSGARDALSADFMDAGCAVDLAFAAESDPDRLRVLRMHRAPRNEYASAEEASVRCPCVDALRFLTLDLLHYRGWSGRVFPTSVVTRSKHTSVLARVRGMQCACWRGLKRETHNLDFGCNRQVQGFAYSCEIVDRARMMVGMVIAPPCKIYMQERVMNPRVEACALRGASERGQRDVRNLAQRVPFDSKRKAMSKIVCPASPVCVKAAGSAMPSHNGSERETRALAPRFKARVP
jgi:hypothetical protein